jgi:hypothetical protein
MFKKILFVLVILVSTVSVAKAGSISKGVWSPTACGTQPVTPVVEQNSIEAYNKSITVVNEWQQKANDFMNCVINEANADNGLIAKTANEEQAQFRRLIDKVKADTDAAKDKLDKAVSDKH